MALLTEYIVIDFTIALLTLLIILYRWLRSINTYWKVRDIPFVKPILLFGNYKDLIFDRQPIHDIHAEIYNKLKGEKFGGYFEMICPVLMVMDPELIEKILVKDFGHFVDRNRSFVDIRKEPLSAGLSFLSGNRWRHMRYKLTPTFTSGKLKGMFEQIYNCGEELIKELNKIAAKGEAAEAKTVMGLFSGDVIASCAFGLQFEHHSEEGKTFRKMVQMGEKVFIPKKIHVLKFFLVNYFTRLGKYIGAVHFPEEMNKYFLSITHATIDYRKKNNIKRNDFLQLLLSLREQEKSGKIFNINHELNEEDAYLRQEEHKVISDDDKIELTNDVMAAQAFLFFSAGSETVSWTTSYTLFSLATHPQIQIRVQEEVDAVLAKHGGWTYQAVKDMTYLDQVIQESLRFHPFISAVTRVVTTPYQIPGTNIVLERGTMINIPVHAMHKDPQLHPDPMTFNPERFKDNNYKMSWKYMPFGHGPRMCIGMRFALLKMKICLGRIMSSFSVTLSDKTQNPLQFKSNIFPRPKGGIWIHFHERRP